MPLPFRRGDTLDYPSKGYDSRFGTYLVEDAPRVDLKMPLKRAREVLTEILHEFCFTNEQSRIHAIARLLTPFARGADRMDYTNAVLVLFRKQAEGRQGLSGRGRLDRL